MANIPKKFLAIKAITTSEQVKRLLNSLKTILRTAPFEKSSHGVDIQLTINGADNPKGVTQEKLKKEMVSKSGLQKTVRKFMADEKIRARYTYTFISDALRNVTLIDNKALNRIDEVSSRVFASARQIFKSNLSPLLGQEINQLYEVDTDATVINVEVNCEPDPSEPKLTLKDEPNKLYVGQTTAIYDIQHIEKHIAEYKRLQRKMDAVKDESWIKGLSEMQLIDVVNVKLYVKAPALVNRRKLHQNMLMHIDYVGDLSDRMNVDVVIANIRKDVKRLSELDYSRFIRD